MIRRAQHWEYSSPRDHQNVHLVQYLLTGGCTPGPLKVVWGKAVYSVAELVFVSEGIVCDPFKTVLLADF